MYVGGVVREQGAVAASMELGNGDTSAILSSDEKLQQIADAWDRSKQQIIQWLEKSDKDMTMVIDVLSQQTRTSDIRKMINDHQKFDKTKWDELVQFLKKRLKPEVYSAMADAQTKYKIPDHFIEP